MNFYDANIFNPMNYGGYYEVILAFLHATPDTLELIDPSDDGDEMWELPGDFVVQFEITDAETLRFSIGHLWFGSINGIPHVAEQNASPIGYYRKITL